MEKLSKRFSKLLAFTCVILLKMLAFICFVWIVLTFWAEREGPFYKREIGKADLPKSALIVYDPDPFYNLDQQVCESFGKGLNDNGWKTVIATVAAAKEIKDSSFQLYVFCANTYNWSPDWAITRFIKESAVIENKNIIAFTLGAGSTGHSQKVLEDIIRSRKGRLIDSRSAWLLRPNDEKLKESNVKVAVDMARKWGDQIAGRLE